MNGLTDSTGRSLPPSETPGPEALRAMGDAVFLTMRSPRHRQVPLWLFRQMVEPPILLGQFRIFRFDDVPRGMFTWGRLSDDAARRYVAGEPLAPDDWRSGDNLWIVDLIAPYRGMTASMARWIMTPGNVEGRAFFFRRVRDGNRTRRIVHVDIDRAGGKARILTNRDFGAD